MTEIIILVTGGFDPIHSGHIAYFKDAKKLGNKLIVGVNSDNWLIQKKGSAFLPIQERIEIVSNLSVVDAAMEFEDDEMGSANNLLIQIRNKYPNEKIIFANGGDRSDTSKILEYETEKKYNIELKFGVGGNHKESSSSDLLKRWSEYSKN